MFFTVSLFLLLLVFRKWFHLSIAERARPSPRENRRRGRRHLSIPAAALLRQRKMKMRRGQAQVRCHYLTMSRFPAHCIPPYRMSGSLHTLAIFHSCMCNAVHNTGQDTEYCPLFYLVLCLDCQMYPLSNILTNLVTLLSCRIWQPKSSQYPFWSYCFVACKHPSKHHSIHAFLCNE